MNFTTIKVEEFSVIGIAVRTTNLNGQSGKDLSLLWKRFFDENIRGLIPNRTDNNVVTLYTDYEGDYKMPYTAIIGCRVKNISDIPLNMIGKIVPSSIYSVFTLQGKLPEKLEEAWEDIWANNYGRTYKADFEVYGVKSLDRDNAEMQIYLGTK